MTAIKDVIVLILHGVNVFKNLFSRINICIFFYFVLLYQNVSIVVSVNINSFDNEERNDTHRQHYLTFNTDIFFLLVSFYYALLQFEAVQ